MTVEPWFAQPDGMVGTAILLPGGMFGVGTPLLHWTAMLLTQSGWSVLGVEWETTALELDELSHVCSSADAALARTDTRHPVLVVAKSLGTLALPWALERGVAGVWLTPLLHRSEVRTAVTAAGMPTLLIGGTADESWKPPAETGSGVSILEMQDANHGLQQPADWRRSILDQIRVFDRISDFAAGILAPTSR